MPWTYLQVFFNVSVCKLWSGHLNIGDLGVPGKRVRTWKIKRYWCMNISCGFFVTSSILSQFKFVGDNELAFPTKALIFMGYSTRDYARIYIMNLIIFLFGVLFYLGSITNLMIFIYIKVDFVSSSFRLNAVTLCFLLWYSSNDRAKVKACSASLKSITNYFQSRCIQLLCSNFSRDLK